MCEPVGFAFFGLVYCIYQICLHFWTGYILFSGRFDKGKVVCLKLKICLKLPNEVSTAEQKHSCPNLQPQSIIFVGEDDHDNHDNDDQGDERTEIMITSSIESPELSGLSG